MPTRAEVEALALKSIDAILADSTPEWDRLELKWELIEPAAAAERIAGHANAARGEWFVWIIGVEPASARRGTRARLQTPPPGDGFERWWQRVQACFDGVAPELAMHFPITDSNLGAHPLVLCFLPAAPPYVVGRGDRMRTPWREGTRTRDATRSDLLRVIVPAELQALVEIADVQLKIDPSRSRGTEVEGHASLLVVSRRDPITIPSISASASLSIDGVTVGCATGLQGRDGLWGPSLAGHAHVKLLGAISEDGRKDTPQAVVLTISIRLLPLDRVVMLTQPLLGLDGERWVDRE